MLQSTTRFSRELRPKRAEGRVCIELTDPITGLTKHKIKGKNHVFDESLFCINWQTYLNSMPLLLNSHTGDVDVDLAYIPGVVTGFGLPSQAGSGSKRGAYSAANQVLGARTYNSIRWFYQYEFTASQALGVIGTVGLSPQYASANWREPIDAFAEVAKDVNNNWLTCDGVYAYKCSTAGVVTKIHLMSSVATTVDVSAIVGATGTKTVGYAPATGRYYVCNSTSKNLYEFSNSSFSTLLNTYSITNINQTTMPMYIHNGYMYTMTGPQATYAALYKSDYVNNTAPVKQNIVKDANATGLDIYLNINTLGYGTYIICGGAAYAYSSYPTLYGGGQGMIYNMENDEYSILGATHSSQSYVGDGDEAGGFAYHPYYTRKVPFYLFQPMRTNAAVTQYKLPSPITKTEANGMIATYEIEVFW